MMGYMGYISAIDISVVHCTLHCTGFINCAHFQSFGWLFCWQALQFHYYYAQAVVNLFSVPFNGTCSRLARVRYN